METTKRKITRATIKSFIKKNFAQLYISHRTKFDGMCDGVMECEDNGFKLVNQDYVPHENAMDATLGIEGAYFAGSGNWFQEYVNRGFRGYSVSNCCGCFVIAVREGI